MLNKTNIDSKNPVSKYIRIDIEDVKEQLGIDLDLIEVSALNAWRESHLNRFIKVCAEDGIQKAAKMYGIEKLAFGDDNRFLVTFISTENTEYNCMFEFQRTPTIPQTPSLVDFRFSTKVTTIEGEKVNLSMFVNDAREVRYEIQEFAEG